MVNDELEGTWTLRHKNFANRTIFRATFSSFFFKNYNWFFTALYLMNLSMLTLAIDQEDIRKEKEKLLWRVDCICFSRNEKWTWQRFGSRTTSFKANQNETTQRITNEPIASSSCQDMTPSRAFISQVRTSAYTTFTKGLFIDRNKNWTSRKKNEFRSNSKVGRLNFSNRNRLCVCSWYSVASQTSDVSIR